MTPEDFQSRFEAVKAEVERVVLGSSDVVEQVLVALFAEGHVLLEGAPGLGKTLLVRALAQVLGVGHKRIQFTPDLMPSDVTGTNVFNQREDKFVFLPGPVFTELLLADEVNRAPAKTQSALLEAMQDASVTTDGTTRPLPSLFFVLATQNPIESQGTYPLPEAQLDRFLFHVRVSYPSRATEVALLAQAQAGFSAQRLGDAGLEVRSSVEQIAEMRAHARSVRVDPEILHYIADVVGRTRKHRAIDVGASPRASLGLLAAARTVAASRGREFVIPDDVKSLAPPVLRHRLTLQPDAEIEGTTADDVIDDILRETPVPKAVA